MLLVDTSDKVLLFQGRDSSRPGAGSWWFTPGGGAGDGETLEQAARREVLEETGIEIGDLGPVVFAQHLRFEFEGDLYDQDEVFFCVRVPEGPEVDTTRWTDLERRSLSAHRWWHLDELRQATETIYPERLVDVLAAYLGSDLEEAPDGHG